MTTELMCPLCHGCHGDLFYQDDNKRSQRIYYRCRECALVYVPGSFYLSSAEEKAEYDQHNNDLADEGYRRFLYRLWGALKPHLQAGQMVLDFGCGPGPLLADMMKQDGFDVCLFDHFYFPHEHVLQPQCYDALTATEVIEHLHNPKQVFERWLSLIKPNGYLGVMTKLVSDQTAFSNWHYKNDMTHVCFFSRDCFEWLAKRYGLTLTFYGQDVIIFRCP